GLNAPQFSAVDLNRDGIPDLHVFDREGNVHLTFLSMEKSGRREYVYAPEYAAGFPRVENWGAFSPPAQGCFKDTLPRTTGGA
ncbi:MAG: hypothetical protein ACKOCH_14090, partial [Bacteroidota bacterium]